MANNCEQNIVVLGACAYPSLVDNGDGTHTFNPGDDVLVTFPTRYLSEAEFTNTTRILTLTMSDGTFYEVDIPCCPTISDNGDNTYTVCDENGDCFIIDANETTTPLVNNGDGTYTYTNEGGVAITFNAGWTTVDNVITDDGSIGFRYPDNTVETIDLCEEMGGCVLFTVTDGTTSQNIMGGDTVTLLESSTVTHTVTPTDQIRSDVRISTDTDNQLSVDPNGGLLVDTVSTLVYNTTTGLLTYTNENGVVTNVMLKLDVLDTETVDTTLTGSGTQADPWVISSDVKVSPNTGNYIQTLPNGLFVDAGISNDLNNILTEGLDGLAYLNCAAILNCLPKLVTDVTMNVDDDGYVVHYNDGTTSDLDCCAEAATLTADFDCPVDGVDGDTFTFAGTSVGSCVPITWTWQRRENASTDPWVTFSTIQNPTNIAFPVADWDIQLIAACADGTTDTHTELACFEVAAVANVIVADFNCPADGEVGDTFNFTDGTTGDCAPNTWTWQRKINGTGTWATFSTAQNPTNIAFAEGVWDIQLIATCADGTTDTHTELACFEVTAVDTLDMDFTCPADGTDPYTVSFTSTSTGTCTPTTWSWESSDDGGTTWTQFSTVQNPANIVFTEEVWSIRVTGTCANGTTNTHTETGCFEVAAAALVLPPCAGTNECIQDSQSGDSTRLAATGFDAGQVSGGGQTFVNTDGVSVTYAHTGGGTIGYNSATTSYGVVLGAGETAQLSVTVSGGCVSGSTGGGSCTVVHTSNDGTTYDLSERPGTPAPLVINDDNTTVVTTVHAPNASGGSNGVYSSNGASSGLTFDITNTDVVGNNFTISIYTNPTCAYDYYAFCPDTGVYTNIHDNTQTTTAEGSYFQPMPCGDVPATP